MQGMTVIIMLLYAVRHSLHRAVPVQMITLSIPCFIMKYPLCTEKYQAQGIFILSC